MAASADFTCASCGAALAPADAVCAACGKAVEKERRLAVLKARAEAQAEAGMPADAARTAAFALGLAPEKTEAVAWLRRRSEWLRKTGDPAQLGKAADALKEALLLEDGDALGHQVWLDLMGRLGRLDEARAWYQGRLKADPEDATAKRQIEALRLMADFRLAPPPKLAIEDAKPGPLGRLFEPTTWKLFSAALGLLSSLLALSVSVFAPGAVGAGAAGLQDSGDSMQSILKMASDPWLNGIQGGLCAVYLIWGIRRRRHGS
jgi:tetratricopeptide (TPR) repeat protein